MKPLKCKCKNTTFEVLKYEAKCLKYQYCIYCPKCNKELIEVKKL